MLATDVSPAVERGLAHAHTRRRFCLSLVAEGFRCSSSTHTRDIHGEVAWWTGPSMTRLGARMATSQGLVTALLAFGNRIRTSLAWLDIHIGELGLPTGAVGDHIGGCRAVRREFVLRMTGFFTVVDATIK